jgi:transcription initiation factor TFIID TATA-box-binding protein
MDIRNIIATTSLGCSLNLKDIAMKVESAKYNPQKFAALTLRIKKPKATAQLFGNGKMVCLGTKSEEQLNMAGTEFARLLTLLGYDAKFKEFTIANVVASCSCGFNLSLEQLQTKLHGAMLEPELFPALQYRMKKTCLLIFHTGKLIATGSKTKEEIDEAYACVLPFLQMCQK